MGTETTLAFTLRITWSCDSLLWWLPLTSGTSHAHPRTCLGLCTSDDHIPHVHHMDVKFATPPSISLNSPVLLACYYSIAVRFGYFPLSSPTTRLLPPLSSSAPHSMTHCACLVFISRFSFLAFLAFLFTSVVLFSFRRASSAFHIPLLLVASCAAILAATCPKPAFCDDKVESGTSGI